MAACAGVTLAGVLALGVLPQHLRAADAPPPPIAERRPVTTFHHGVAITDDYGWLRTEKLEQVLQNPETLEAPIRKYLEAENRYAHAVLAANRTLERTLLAEMKSRVSPRDASVPQPWGPWEYYMRYAEGSQRRLHCRRPRGGGPEQVMLDENALARGRRAFSVTDTAVSLDHKLLAYAVDADGSERNTLKVREIATGRDLPDAIHEVRGGAVWSADSQWLFYVGRDPSKWGQKVFRHRLGTPVSEDELVYEEVEEGFSVSLRSTLSDRFLVIEAGDFSTTDIKLVELAHPTMRPRSILKRVPGDKYFISDLGDRLIVMTNAGGATDWKLVEKPLSAPADAPFTEIVPHVPGRVIEDFAVFRDHLVWLERDRERGRQQIRVRRWSDGAEHAITFGEEPSKVELVVGLEQNTRTLRYTYQSMAQPLQVFDYDLDTRVRTLRRVQEVPSGYDPARYVTRRIEAPARDGASIPATILYRRDTPLDGSAPVWLYAYGAYGDTEYPDFGTERLSLVDRGFIDVIAHVRGGGEKGEPWHEAGRLGNKTTSFTDFIAVAEHLIRLEDDAAGPHRGLGRLGRRHARRRSRQHAARAVRRHLRRGAVRGRAQHAARPHAPPDRIELLGIRQSNRQQGGLLLPQGLFALRQCARPGLSADARLSKPQQLARALLGGHQVGGQAAPPQDRQEPHHLAGQHAGRPRRRLGPLRYVGGVCPRLRLRPQRDAALSLTT